MQIKVRLIISKLWTDKVVKWSLIDTNVVHSNVIERSSCLMAISF